MPALATSGGGLTSDVQSSSVSWWSLCKPSTRGVTTSMDVSLRSTDWIWGQWRTSASRAALVSRWQRLKETRSSREPQDASDWTAASVSAEQSARSIRCSRGQPATNVATPASVTRVAANANSRSRLRQRSARAPSAASVNDRQLDRSTRRRVEQ